MLLAVELGVHVTRWTCEMGDWGGGERRGLKGRFTSGLEGVLSIK